MNKKTLTGLFAEAIYRIPDYQRGYAWEEKQWKDFIEDVDALVDDKVTGHYTGTVVVFSGRETKYQQYGTKRLHVVDVVDGQQRLTTSCLYLSVIIRALIGQGERAYKRDVSDFLYSGAVCKLALNYDTSNTFYDLLKSGRPNIESRSPHEKRLVAACNRFQQHIDKQIVKRGAASVSYLKDLFHAITQKLHFTFYTIEEECEIGMTFELMNSRGKDLSVLELLKNYLMHWVSRNENDAQERATLTSLINKNWKDTYTNIGQCSGDEDQCLRIAWTLYCNHSPSNWIGYDGFKDDDYIPLRAFSAKRTKADTKAFIIRFADGLSEVSKYYASIARPTTKNKVSQDELTWLSKIHRTGNIANFLPLMVAARKGRETGCITETHYVNLLKALECYAYRVFLFDGRRSNAGKSNFYRWGNDIFNQKRGLEKVSADIHALARYYAPEKSFNVANSSPDDWYSTRRLLKYTLFEYELHLLQTEGKGKQPYLGWKQINDSTIEHILPQNPEKGSLWREKWSSADMKKCKHDIANLVLTQNNSNYSNFEFSRKKGKPGQSPSYSNSDIRQERKIAAFSGWTRKEFDKRKAELEIWITNRWKTEMMGDASLDIVDEADGEA